MTTFESVIFEKSKLLIPGVKGKIGVDGKVADLETVEKLKVLGKSLLESIDNPQ